MDIHRISSRLRCTLVLGEIGFYFGCESFLNRYWDGQPCRKFFLLGLNNSRLKDYSGFVFSFS